MILCEAHEGHEKWYWGHDLTHNQRSLDLTVREYDYDYDYDYELLNAVSNNHRAGQDTIVL